MSIHPLSESQDYDLSEFVGNSRLQLQTGCNGIKVFQQFWLIGAFWVFSTILMLFPRNHFFNIAGRPVVLWLRFLVFETFCCVWQAGHAFCCVCRKFVVAELGFSRNTRCQRLSPTELGNRIGDLDPSDSVLGCGVQQDRAVLLRILKILSFCHRSWKRRKECSIQRDCQDLNFHRLSVKSCQIRAGKCTDFSQQIDRLNDWLIYSEYIDLIWFI